MEYSTPIEIAREWGVTRQYVTRLCAMGQVRGAYKEGRNWFIPAGTPKPNSDYWVSGSAADPIGPLVDMAYTARTRIAHDRLPLPVGVSSFEEAVTHYAYVDKTRLIKELLDARAKVTLFLRPRRFGKTLNMDMLRCFFEINDDNTASLFQHKDIWRAGATYMREQGRYPVVMLSFKDAKALTWEGTLTELRTQIRLEFARHADTLAKGGLTGPDGEYYLGILEGSLPQAELHQSLRTLMRMLHQHYGVAPILIIDEYDTPIQEGHFRGYYDEVIAFMRMMLSAAVKDNPHLSFAYLTGVMRVAKESIFSGLNNLEVDSVLGGRYGAYFGFTSKEVKSLLVQYGKPSSFAQAAEWYDGYLFGKHEIFNPWSIVNYLANDFTPRGYWRATGSNEVLGQIVDRAEEETLAKLQVLLRGEPVRTLIDDAIAYPTITGNSAHIFSFLLLAGYLRVDELQYLDQGDYFCSVRIPNKEIRGAYAHEILSLMPREAGQGAAISVKGAMLSADAEELERALGKYVYQAVSYHDTTNEAFFHGLVVGLCAIFEGRYEIRSNRESGTGRYDVQLAPRQLADPGIVIEVKALRGQGVSADEVGARAEDALAQISENDYAAELRDRGCRRILGVGLAFAGKQTAVRTTMFPTNASLSK